MECSDINYWFDLSNNFMKNSTAEFSHFPSIFIRLHNHKMEGGKESIEFLFFLIWPKYGLVPFEPISQSLHATNLKFHR